MTISDDRDDQGLVQQPFVSHLLELRDRLLRMVIAAFVVFVLLFPFANDLYTALATPLIRHLPEGTGMIATRVISPFLTPLKLAFVMAIFLTVPYILHQLWSFVAPGLYRHEKRLAMPLLASSVFLFYLGMAFAYFVVFPLLFDILPSMAPEQITVSPDISDYLDFVLTLFFAFGVAFEVPIATIILVWMGITTPGAMAEKRPYVVIGAFFVGMLLTPPDIISQTLLALPMWLLFEIGVICSRAFVRDREDAEPAQHGMPERFDDDGPGPETGPPEPGPGPEPGPDQAPVRPGPVSYSDCEFNPANQAPASAGGDWPDAAGEEDDGHDGEPHPSRPPANAAARPGREAVNAKLRRIVDYRDEAKDEQARALLYEVLAEGDKTQVEIARDMLKQLDGG
ncbi:MAG TPA: twin-arginine translocase subunit TatC [Sedimenticola sp.]|nr:twin-arginine translocase subunit TatC [Sedimenticola sp.]